MDERLRFVTEVRRGLFTMTALCAQFGISRKTGYQLRAAYARDGLSALTPRSRRPHSSPTATTAIVVKALVACRRRHPSWGPKKLIHYLHRHEPGLCGATEWPGVSTVARVLSRQGLVEPVRVPRRVWRSAAATTLVSTAPNVIWTADFKGEFRTRDGRWCYPLTVMDAFSRYLLRCEGFLGPTNVATQAGFRRLFEQFGLPDRIRTDNGTPFAGPGVGGLSPLSVWWLRLGIAVDRIARGHPEQNGAHERMHRTLKAATTRPPSSGLLQQQRRFTAFRREYNDERPHEALHFEVPATLYTPSRRTLPTRLSPTEYAGHVAARRVYAHGDIRWQGRRLFLSEALAGETVGLEEVDDGIWDIHFASVTLARLEQRTWRVLPPTR